MLHGKVLDLFVELAATCEGTCETELEKPQILQSVYDAAEWSFLSVNSVLANGRVLVEAAGSSWLLRYQTSCGKALVHEV